MANYYLHHGAYPTYSATPTWNTAQDGDGTALGLSTPATASILINAVAVATNTITIAGRVLTAVASGAAANQFNVGATVDIQADNIATSINAASGVTNSGTNNTNTQLRDWCYARGPSNGAPAGTVEIMTRVGSAQFNYATNSNVAITSGGWGTPPTITDFAGGAGGVAGYFINTGTMFPSIKIGGTYGFMVYAQGPSSIIPGAGDIIYVRTKASGSDITCSNTSFNNTNISIRQFSTTITNPTKVIFDNGTIWSGDNGVFTLNNNYNGGSSVYNIVSNSYLSFFGTDRTDLGAGKKSFKISNTGNIAAGYYIQWNLASASSYHEHMELSDEHTGTYTSASAAYLSIGSLNLISTHPAIFNKCTFRTNGTSANGYSPIGHAWSYPANFYFKECSFIYTNQSSANGGLLTNNSTTAGTSTAMVFDGCTFSGIATAANKLLSTSGAGKDGTLPASYVIKNCSGIGRIAGTMGFFAHSSTFSSLSTGLDVWNRYISVSTKEMSYFENNLGYYVMFNAYGLYPTLYAVSLEGTAFSCLISPSSRTSYCVSSTNPFYTSEMSKLNSLADGSRTVTVEFLIDTNYGTLDTEDLALEISYVNTSGNQVFYNTKAATGEGTSLTTSTANWSDTNYIVNSINHTYNKRKIEVTLPENVKQNTFIQVKVATYVVAPSSDDFFFVDPEIVVA